MKYNDKLPSFLDGLNIPDGCFLICHDENHNGDVVLGQGCGNPRCAKHEPGNSPRPHAIRPPMCRCPLGTFEDDFENNL
jgi:hypothetical protein